MPTLGLRFIEILGALNFCRLSLAFLHSLLWRHISRRPTIRTQRLRRAVHRDCTYFRIAKVMVERKTAAVIGLGAAGLVALKNLKEEGFNVIGFERNAYIGGLWKYSEDEQTSVLNTTVVNISKERVRS